MSDQASNLFDTGRFLKIMADIEHDDPEQAPECAQPFKRDQNLTPQALFKAKVLAVLRDELDGDSPRWDSAISEVIRRVEGIPL